MADSQTNNRRNIAADAVLFVHALVSLYAVAGAFLTMLSPLSALVHVPLVIWVSVVNLASWTCPLTPLEQHLRRLAGQQPFEGGWFHHYCAPLLGPLREPRRLELVVGTSIIVWNALVYAWILYRLSG